MRARCTPARSRSRAQPDPSVAPTTQSSPAARCWQGVCRVSPSQPGRAFEPGGAVDHDEPGAGREVFHPLFSALKFRRRASSALCWSMVVLLAGDDVSLNVAGVIGTGTGKRFLYRYRLNIAHLLWCVLRRSVPLGRWPPGIMARWMPPPWIPRFISSLPPTTARPSPAACSRPARRMPSVRAHAPPPGQPVHRAAGPLQP